MKEWFVPSTRVVNLCKHSRNFSRVKTLIIIRYISALEERIAFLEARLPDHAKDHYNGGADELQRPPNMEPEQPMSDSRGRRESCRDSQSGSVSEDLDLDQKTSLVDGVAYLSLCASGTTDTNHEPYYVGSSSGAAIARVIQSSIYRGSGNKSVDTPAASHAESVPEAPISTQSTAFASLSQHISEFPDPEKARMLFDFFFERIHPRWPLLDRAKYETVVKKQHSPESLTITERSILHLIYAITARFLAVTKKSCGVDDEVRRSKTLPISKLIFASHSSLQRRDRWNTS